MSIFLHKWRMSILVGLLMLTPSSVFAQQTAQTEANITDGCVTEFDSQVDYFPQKTELEYSVGWTVEYFDNYKVINVLRPWPGAAATDAFQYVLVQCGTPAPEEGYEDAQVIEVPSGRVIALSTTQLPHLAELGLVDQLIGLDSFLYVNTPEIVERIESGELIEVGSGSSINVEQVLELDPDIVMSFGSGFPEYDAHPVLLDAGIFVAINSDYVEETPLGRAEWIKFTALFYNLEGAARDIFNEKATAYNDLLALTADIPQAERPEVLWNSFSTFTEAWSIPGAQTYAGRLLQDAGAAIALGELAPDESANIDFEIVYEGGLDADFWFPGLFGIGTLDDVLAQDERYADFAAVENGTVYNNDARVNANGGNDSYESGVVNPHLVLADLVAILHPDLLPDHEVLFFRQLP